MQQYFLNEEFNIESTYELSKDDSNHIVRIMRKKIDDKVYVVFNNEVKYICTIVDNNVDKVLVTPYKEVVGTNSKINRWNKIVKEAAEQSKRNIIPDITYVDSLKDLITFSEKFNHKVVAYEKESVNKENINLKNLLHSDLSNKEVIAVFGSEGGLSEKEVDFLTENKFDVIGLGKRILRAETAPLYFVSCVAYFSEFN